MGLITVQILLMKRIGIRSWFFLIGLSLFVFWPISVVKATDVNNDMLVMAFILWSFCHTLDWYKKPVWESARNVLLIGAVAMCIKSSGMVAFAIFGVATFLLFYERRLFVKDLASKRYILLGCVCVLLSVSNTVRLYADRNEGDGRSLLVFHDIIGHPQLWYPEDKPSYYLSFDYEKYLNVPFYNSFEDSSGRKYFWNALLKTSLFGEWTWQKPQVAISLSILFLAMTLYLFYESFYLKIKPKNMRECIFLSRVIMGLFIAMLMAFRIQFPAGCNQDMRYIYAILPIFTALYAASIQNLWQWRKTYAASFGLALYGSFTMLSIYFMLAQYVHRF